MSFTDINESLAFDQSSSSSSSKYAVHHRPTQTNNMGVNIQWLAQDICQPKRRSMLNTYLLDAKDYQAAAVLRLWYATYCYTQVESKKLRVVRAKILCEKFFDRTTTTTRNATTSSSERDYLPWDVSSANEFHFVRKLRSSDVSVREKDAIVVQIKRAAFRFLETRVKSFEEYRTKNDKRKKTNNRRKSKTNTYDNKSSRYSPSESKSNAATDSTCSSAGFFRDLQLLEPDYDLSLRLSDLTINISPNTSSRRSNQSSNDSSNNNSIPTSCSDGGSGGRSSTSRSSLSLSVFTPPVSSRKGDPVNDSIRDEIWTSERPNWHE